jgi:hypothetical protein
MSAVVAVEAPFAQGDTTVNLPTNGIASVATMADIAESITVPMTSDTKLLSFQFYGFGAGSAVLFNAQVFQFDPSTLTSFGDPLYTSSIQTATTASVNPPVQTFAFSPNLNLTAGGHYLLVLNQDVFSNAGNLQILSSAQTYSGGTALLQMAGVRSWTTFHNNYPQSLAFQAVFTTVPEPASLALLGLGAAALLSRRRVAANRGDRQG